MKSDANSSAPISATTSTSAAPAAASETESEADFLARQAADAASAIPRLLAELKENALATIDPRLWTKDHPWASIGVAVAGAFTAASVIVPSRRHAHHFHPKPEPERARHEPKKPQSWKHKMIHEIFAVARPAVASALAAAIKCKSGEPAEHDGNGQH